MHKFIFISSLLFLVAGCNHAVERSSDEDFKVLDISDSLLSEMKKKNVFGDHSPVPVSRLKLVVIRHYDFDGSVHRGELVVLDACSEQVKIIFRELYDREFAIARVRLMTEYTGNDSLSMADNNTSAHNLRQVTDGDRLSLHAYGTAIDLNPVQNPYLDISCEDSLGIARFQPAAGIYYANRRESRPGKEARKGMAEDAVDIFANNGFYSWGGYWDCPIDYQHFQISRSISEVLVSMEPSEARRFFTIAMNYYNRYQQPLEEKLLDRLGNSTSLLEHYQADRPKFHEVLDELE